MRVDPAPQAALTKRTSRLGSDPVRTARQEGLDPWIPSPQDRDEEFLL